MRLNWDAALSAARSIGKHLRAVARRGVSAVLWLMFVAGITLVILLTREDSRAGGLRVGKRVEQEMYAPLVPVTKNFRLCFQADPDGVPVLGLCLRQKTDDEELRQPAGRSPGLGQPPPREERKGSAPDAVKKPRRVKTR